MNAEKERQPCPVCGKMVRLTRWGKVPFHYNDRVGDAVNSCAGTSRVFPSGQQDHS